MFSNLICIRHPRFETYDDNNGSISWEIRFLKNKNICINFLFHGRNRSLCKLITVIIWWLFLLCLISLLLLFMRLIWSFWYKGVAHLMTSRTLCFFDTHRYCSAIYYKNLNTVVTKSLTTYPLPRFLLLRRKTKSLTSLPLNRDVISGQTLNIIWFRL